VSPAVELPLVDEHAIHTRADPIRVWEAIPEAIQAVFDRIRARALAGLLGCRDRRATRPFGAAAGSTVPGFRVAHVGSPRELELEGSHRFASYALTFVVEPADGGATLRAVTRARFPGLRGALYRAAVIGSGGHRIVTRRILRSIARRAERAHSHREEGK
jgi:hypothetical protein